MFILYVINIIIFSVCYEKLLSDWLKSVDFDFLKHNKLQINALIFSINIHNPEVSGSNPDFAT